MNSDRCPYCGAKVVLRDASFVYHTKKSESYGKVWVCSNFPKCNAYVGCHKGTTIPKGRLANPRLRCLKEEAHKQFDPLWKCGLMSRQEAYVWLASMLHISLEDCHIGMFDVKMCQKVIHICSKQNNPAIEEFKNEHYSRRTFVKGYHKKNHRH